MTGTTKTVLIGSYVPVFRGEYRSNYGTYAGFDRVTFDNGLYVCFNSVASTNNVKSSTSNWLKNYIGFSGYDYANNSSNLYFGDFQIYAGSVYVITSNPTNRKYVDSNAINLFANLSKGY